MLWTTSNATDVTVWHLGRVREYRTDSGRVYASVVVPACRGRRLGGPWGETHVEADTAPPGDGVCRRCAAIVAKAVNNSGV